MRTTAADTPRIPGLRLTDLLGTGQDTRVYAATREIDGWACAVKVYAGDDPSSVRRGWREAALSGSLRLPHLVRIHEVVETADGAPALVLDRVGGGTVADLIDQRGHLSPGETVTIVAPVLATLAALHDQGIVHGDIAARNILLDEAGRPFVTDLGDARLVGEHPAEHAATPGDTAPEVVAGQPPTAAADIYSAGALAWRCLTGQSPAVGLVRPPLTALNPAAPEALVTAVEGMLVADPSARPSAQPAHQSVLASARPEPLARADGQGTDDALTYRLRAHLGGTEAGLDDGAVGGDDEGGRRGTGRRGAGRRGGHRGPRRSGGSRRTLTSSRARGSAGRALGRASADSGADPTAAKPRRSAKGIAVVVVATGVLVLGLGDLLGGSEGWPGVWRQITAVEPGTDNASGPGGAGAGSETGTGAPAAAAGGAATGAVSPEVAAEVSTALQRLVAARAAAYRSGDPAFLTTVFAPSTSDLATERAAVQQLREAGATYQGLSYRLREVSVLSVSEDVAVVRATLDTSSYTIARRGHDPAQRPGATGHPMIYELRRVAGEWRLGRLADS